MLKEGLRWGTSSRRPGLTTVGGRKVLTRRGRCPRRACWGQQLPTAWADHPKGTGSPAQAAVGAQGGPAGDSGSQWRAHQHGGRGVAPGRRSVP